MRRLIDNDYLTLVFRLAVGITFIYASYYKIVDPAGFARSIWYYHLLPGDVINIMALILPWIELWCGLGLIFGFWYRGSALIIGAMTIVFILALSSALVRGINIECGCFKVARASNPDIWKSVIFDLGLMVMIVQLWLSRSKRWMFARA